MSDAGGMLETGLAAVEVMTEYVRACRQLGHPTPEPSQLRDDYTAEQGMELRTLDDDARALSTAVSVAEEALQVQEHARRTLDAAWRGAGAEAAADQLRRHADAARSTVDGLRSAATALDVLRNRLWQLIDAKVDTTLDVEARGLRAEWLSAARTVTTGAGDRAAASELVDMQVAPFVADDIGGDWVSAMRDTEAAIRQAYRSAVSAMTGGATVMFDGPGSLGPIRAPGSVPVAAEQVYLGGGAAAATAPAGYNPAPISWPDPAPAAPAPGPPAAGAPVVPTPSVAAPPAPSPAAETMAAPPMSPPGGLGGGMSPLGTASSGLSGAGQSVADILGGLLGSGGDLSGAGLGDADDLDPLPQDEPVEAELEDDEDAEDDGDDDGDDEEPAGDEPKDGEVVVDEPPVEADPAPAEEPVEPVVTEPVPTPVPEPMADPVPAAPAEPAPADTPCEIAADELPQAGP